MKSKSYRIRIRKQDLLALSVFSRAQTGTSLPQGKLVANALGKWSTLDNDAKLAYLRKTYHTANPEKGRTRTVVRVSYENHLDILVLADWRKALHGEGDPQAVPVMALAAVVDYVTNGANVTPMPEKASQRADRPPPHRLWAGQAIDCRCGRTAGDPGCAGGTK